MTGDLDWLKRLDEQLSAYLQTLNVPGEPGRFLPATSGLTEQSTAISLGFSCFAAKLYYILGLWDDLSPDARESWLHFIRSFQIKGRRYGDRISHNAFIDPPVLAYLERNLTWRQRLKTWLRPSVELSYAQMVISGETKQAIATLAEVDAASRYPYRGFPGDKEAVTRYLGSFDWSQPWGAGAHFATLAVYFATQAPRMMDTARVNALKQAAITFVEDTLHPETGGYFKGAPPPHGQLINGAMKVLTGLDWVETPPHYPEQLIDTCLTQLPEPEGCHLVDAVYVLYRCAQVTRYRHDAIQAYCRNVLQQINAHFVPEEGGFSYYIGKSQTSYYGVPITEGLPVADLHGTILLTWALAMIADLLNIESIDWRIIRP